MDDKVKHLEKLIRGMEAAKAVNEKELLFIEGQVLMIKDRIEAANDLIDEYINELCEYVSKDVDTARQYLNYVGVDHEGLYKKFEDGINKILKYHEEH